MSVLWLVFPSILQAESRHSHYVLRAGGQVFTVRIARTHEARRTGLMWERSLPDNEGLLMVMPKPVPVTVWMKNMNFPLDVVWISADGTVLDKMTVPPCRTWHCPRYQSGKPAKYLLEVNGGRFPLEAGQKVEFLGASRDSLLPLPNDVR